MIRVLSAVAILFASPVVAQETTPLGGTGSAPSVVASGVGVVLRGLDKVSGDTIDVELATGTMTRLFGLDVRSVECRYPADNPSGDAVSFLQIYQTGTTDTIFQGWMMASAPALNALDHSRYDVWVLRCITS
jgi:hypothetical protein